MKRPISRKTNADEKRVQQTYKIQLINTSREELVERFKESIQSREKSIKAMAKYLHGEIFPLLALLKMQIQMHELIRENEAAEINFGKEKKLIDRISDNLRSVYEDLHPSTLEFLGLIKTLEAYKRKFANKHPESQIIFNNSCDLAQRFSAETELHVLKIFELLLNLFLLSPLTEIEIFLYIKDDNFHLDFVREKGVVDDYEAWINRQSLDEMFKDIQVQLLLVNASVNKFTDWTNLICLTIPFNQQNR